MKHNLKTLRKKYVELDEKIAKLPEEYFDRIGSASVDLDTEFTELKKELRELDWRKYGTLSLIKEILGESE